MNYAAVEKFLSKLPVRDRDSSAVVPFKFFYNQKKLHRAASEMADAGKPVRLIVCKARRVTCSSWAEGILFCHGLAFPSSHSLIVADAFKTSKVLMRVPQDFIPAVPFLNIDAIEREIRFPHPSGEALMQLVTAGKDTSGRGFTLSALHASECAHYISPEVFPSLLPALQTHKNTIGIIETTPNGREGEGEIFYDMYWDAAEGKSEWKAVFLTWVDDPACVADESFASDAPADEEERDLLKRGLNKSQLAWRRLKIRSPECSGSVAIFHQEYATTAEESFIASGMPAFELDEINWARKHIRKPLWQGFIERSTDGTLSLRKHAEGTLRIYEDPIPGHYYYIGCDAARGDEGRDFSAIGGFDGTTGHQVFSYADYCLPEIMGCHANSLGLHYNRAMVNGDLTGGYGSGALYTMREILRYPNLYRWKGKDDKLTGSSLSKSLWIDITSWIRSQLFEYMRLALREAAATDGDYGIVLYDADLVSQIELCTRKDTRIDVRKGHDDILFAAMIANLARFHWAPPRMPNRIRSHDDEEEAAALNSIRTRGDQIVNDTRGMLARHHAKISQTIDHPPRRDFKDDANSIMEDYDGWTPTS